jgi:hypothetical protein
MSFFDTLVDFFTSTEASPASLDSMPSSEWHNGFGTLNDYEVPASSSYDSFSSLV